MRHKKVMAVAVLIIVFGMALTSLLVQSATQTINIQVSGTNSSGKYNATLTGDFLGDAINYSTFEFDWGEDEGELLVHTARGLLKIKMSEGDYDYGSQQFKINKFTYTYPSGYPYTITLDMVIGSSDSSSFTGYIIGRYTETGTSEEEDDEECEDCCDITYTNDGSAKTIHVEARGDKDIASAGVLFYATGSGTQSMNMNKVSNRLWFVDFYYGDVPVQRFTATVSFTDGTSYTSGLYTVSSSSSSGWGTWSGGSTSSDYTTALNTAKAKGFTTVVALINDMNTSIKNKNEQIQTQQTTLAQRNAELESARSSSANYQQLYQNEQTAKNNLQNQYDELQTKYNNLFKENGGQTVTPSVPTEIDMRYIAGGTGVAVLLGILIKKKKLPFKRKQKVDIHRNNGMPREPMQNNHRQEPEYPPVPGDIYYTPNVDRIIDESIRRGN